MLSKGHVGLLLRVVVAKVDDNWLTVSLPRPLLQDPESTGLFPPIYVREKVYRRFGLAHSKRGGGGSIEFLRLSNDHGNG